MTRVCPNSRPFDQDGMCTCGEGHQEPAALADDATRVLEGDVYCPAICSVCGLALDSKLYDHSACVAPFVSGSEKSAS